MDYKGHNSCALPCSVGDIKNKWGGECLNGNVLLLEVNLFVEIPWGLSCLNVLWSQTVSTYKNWPLQLVLVPF